MKKGKWLIVFLVILLVSMGILIFDKTNVSREKSYQLRKKFNV